MAGSRPTVAWKKRVARAPPARGNVKITNIFYDGAGSNEPDKYVELRNDGSAGI